MFKYDEMAQQIAKAAAFEEGILDIPDTVLNGPVLGAPHILISLFSNSGNSSSCT